MMTIAGMKPATNSATAEVLVTCAITIMKIAGGTSMPIAVPAAIREARIAAVVTGVGQRRHQRGAERGDLGHFRSADIGEEIRHHDHRHAEPALDPADQRARQLDQRVAHAAALHQIAREHEGRDCEQHPALRPGDQRRGKLLQRIAADQQAGDAGDAEREHDRHGEQDQPDEDDGDGSKQHGQCRPRSMQRVALRRRRDDHRNPVDDDQDAADHGGCVEPG